jgi:hypothetical protein
VSNSPACPLTRFIYCDEVRSSNLGVGSEYPEIFRDFHLFYQISADALVINALTEIFSSFVLAAR